MYEEVLERLEKRMGRLHANQRLGIEIDHETQIFGQGLNFFHIENWYSIHSVIRAAFKLTGLYRRGAKNAERVQVRHTDLQFKSLPQDFDTFTILHISDFHVDMNRGAMQRLIEILPTLEYDLCVLTGDYRGETFGPFEPALNGLAEVRARLKGPIYGVLGNHDTIRMVPRLEDMGIRMLLNECETVSRGHQQVFLAVSMMRISTGLTISRSPPQTFRQAHFPFCCRTRRKSIVRPPMPDLICDLLTFEGRLVKRKDSYFKIRT